MKNKPLKRNVLVCKEDVLDKVLRIDNDKYKSLSNKEKDYLLKTIAAYLIHVKKNQDSVSLVISDINNWSLFNPKYSVNDYCFEDKKYPINKTSNGINLMISIEKRIKDNYRIVDINNVDSIAYGETVFIDNGAKEVLKGYHIESSIDLENLKNNIFKSNIKK